MKLYHFALTLIFIPKLGAKFHHRFTRIECGSSLITIEKQYCFLKAYKRNQPVMNYGFILKRKAPNGKVWMKLLCQLFYTNLTFFKVFLSINRKDNQDNYVSQLKFLDLEWCKIVKGLKLIPIFDSILSAAKELGEDLIELCWKTGEIKIANASLSKSPFVTQFPSGDYKTAIRFFDDDDSNIMNFTFYSHISQ